MPKSDLEFRLEAIKNRGNLRLEYLQRFYDRRSIIERYINGEVVTHIHGSVGDSGGCIILRIEPNNREGSVFVWIRQGTKHARPLASSAWLQLHDCCLVNGSEEFAPIRTSRVFALTDTSTPSLWGIFDRKLCAILDRAGIEKGQFENQIIQRGSKVIDSFPDKNTKDWWSGRNDNYWIIRCADKTLYGLKPFAIMNARSQQFPFNTCQVLFSPIYSEISVVKRWLYKAKTESNRRHVA